MLAYTGHGFCIFGKGKTMSKSVFIVTPTDHPNAAPYQAPDAKEFINQTLTQIAKTNGGRQVIVIVEVMELS